ncbi:MAG: S41 family peptidase [Candidatus Promineifilaceae bacterium]|nr:S41 family peptidase [Candidatus Promineifilaceae bacterium]
MSNKQRNGLTIIMLLLLAASAFVAGYFTNGIITSRNGSAHAQEQFDVFWEAWGRIENNFIGDLPDDSQRTYGAIRGSMQALNDPYTVFIEPVARQREREQLEGIFGGIGAYVSRPEDGGPIVLEPIPGNPAEAAGILVGDILQAVDGMAITAEMTVADVADLVKGEKGTAVVLTILHSGETEAVEISVIRGDILIPSVVYRLLEEDQSIGYIRLSRFSGESGEEVADAIRDLQDQNAERFILDLRQNRGGLLDAAIDITDHFLNEGPIAFQQSKEEGERAFNATSVTLAEDAPLVVLIDGGSASASEIVAGALQDRERATLIGAEPTFGKGSVQLVFDLSDGSSVHVTSARWFTPGRTQLDGEGIPPDILVELTQEALDNGRDEVLNRAIEHLREVE